MKSPSQTAKNLVDKTPARAVEGVLATNRISRSTLVQLLLLLPVVAVIDRTPRHRGFRFAVRDGEKVRAKVIHRTQVVDRKQVVHRVESQRASGRDGPPPVVAPSQTDAAAAVL